MSGQELYRGALEALRRQRVNIDQAIAALELLVSAAPATELLPVAAEPARRLPAAKVKVRRAQSPPPTTEGLSKDAIAVLSVIRASGSLRPALALQRAKVDAGSTSRVKHELLTRSLIEVSGRARGSRWGVPGQVARPSKEEP